MNRSLLSRILAVLGLVLVLMAPVTALFFPPVESGTGRLTGIGWIAAGNLVLGLAAVAGGLLLSGPGGMRRFFAGRASYFGFFTALSALIVVAVLAAANWIAWAKPRTWDLTRNRIFTLAEDTVRTLRGLDRDVRVLAFYQQSEQEWAVADDLLKRYHDVSPRFGYELVDPYRQPDLVKRYAIVQGGPRIVLLAGGREARAKEPTEEALTNGLVELTRTGKKRIYFTTGHGEPSPADSGEKGYALAAKGLREDGFEVEPLSLLEKGEVPADASAILVAGARKAFLDPEVKALEAFLARGGHVGLYLEPEVEPGLDTILKAWGIEADRDMVVDPSPVSRIFGGSPVTPIVAPVQRHPIARDLQNVGVALPTARSLTARTDTAVRPEPVLLTGESAWGETDIAGLFGKGAKYDEGEKKGPIPVAMTATNRVEGKGEGRLLVVGDSEFFDDRYQQVLGNLDFFLNGVAWLAEQPDRITIRPRAREASRLFLSEAQVAGIRFVTLDAIPVALLALGLTVWTVRRSR